MKKLTLKLLKAGYCVHPEKVAIKDGSYKSIDFPALVALIEHPTKGYYLMDTGYSDHFFKASQTFPFSIYPKITPVKYTQVDSIVDQLKELNISPSDINGIIVTHFHGDHVGGLLDFPDTTFYCTKKAYDAVKRLKGFRALKAGFLPGLLPDDFEERVIFVDEQEELFLPDIMDPFQKGFDVFGDGSLFAVDLTGHAIGQIGLFFHDENKGDVFLCADACWQSRAYREHKLPSALAYLIIPDVKAYKDKFFRLHQLYRQNPSIHIIPTHCQEIWEDSK